MPSVDRTAELDRMRARRLILKELGVEKERLGPVSQSPRQFEAELVARGIDPMLHADLLSKSPRMGCGATPLARARYARYHYLRACGLPSNQCSAAVGTPNVFAFFIRRRIAAGIQTAWAPLPLELDDPRIPPEVPRAGAPTEKEPA